MYSWKDRLREMLGMDRVAAIHLAMAVIISVIIAAVLVNQLGVGQGTYDADMARLEQGITTMGSDVADNAQDIAGVVKDVGDLVGDVAAINTNYAGIPAMVGLHADTITLLQGRMDTAEGSITALDAGLATVASPPEAYLTGNLTAGNITIHAEASYNGTYTANVHLVFASVVVNWTATVNWAAPNVKAYVPVETYNGTAWEASQAWWSIGTFDLVAHTEKAINVLFGGLADTPSYAYVEIYPVLK